MIKKSDMLKVNSIQYYMYEPYLAFNVLHDRYLGQAIVPLRYFYRGRYGNNMQNNMTYEAKFFV